MINVDGVIYGNFRCDLSGSDMNRKWVDFHPLLQPQLEILIKKLKNIHARTPIASFIDFHGHSKLYNMFCYSCKKREAESRILPMMWSEFNKDFNF